MILGKRLTGPSLIAIVTLVDVVSSCWFGYCQGVIAGVLVSPDFEIVFPQVAQNAGVSGIVASCFLLGAAFGCLVAFVAGDKLGRKRVILIGHLLSLVGTALQFPSWSLGQFVVGRLVNGAGIGLTSSTTPVLLAECAPSRLRGRLVVIGSASNVTCFCLANWISYGLYYNDGPFQWRFPLALPLVFPLFVFPLLAAAPESPRFLLLAGREHAATRVISRLSGFDPDEGADNPVVTAQVLAIKEALEIERRNNVSVTHVLRVRDKTQNLRRLILGCGAQFMQQLTGINALGFYLPTLLEVNLGYDNRMARLLSAISATVYFAVTCCSFLVIDRVGRRKLMMYGSFLCGFCYIIASICLKKGEDDPSKSKPFGSAAVAMLFLYHAAFGPTSGGVPWVYAAEVNALAWRARGAGAATGTQWLIGFAIVQFTKTGIDNLRWAFYLIFGVICIFLLVVVYLFYPETSHRSLEDMDHIFLENPSWLVCGKKELTSPRRPEAFVLVEQQRLQQTATPSTGATRGSGLGSGASTSSPSPLAESKEA